MTTGSTQIVLLTSLTFGGEIAAINDAGEIGGEADYPVAGTTNSYNPHVAIWLNGTVQNVTGNTDGSVLAINQAGTLAGFQYGPYGTPMSDVPEAFIVQNGVFSLLPANGGQSYANGINNSDQVVGQYTSNANGSGGTQAALWQNGVLQLLPLLPNGPGTVDSCANAINDSGQIVGFSALSASASHAVLWQNGTVTDLGALATGDTTDAQSINKSGLIVGYDTVGVTSSAVEWRNGVISALPGLAGYGDSWAYSVNDAGIIAGSVATATIDPTTLNYVYHAVIWVDGQITDLNSLLPANSGWVLTSANTISNTNEIAGYGSFDGKGQSFELTLGSTGPGTIGVAAQTALTATLTAPVTVIDSAADASANLDGLQALASAGKLAGITLTDGGIPNLTVTAAAYAADASALSAISSPHTITLQFAGDAGQHDFALDNLAGVSAVQFADQTVIVAAPTGPASAVTTGNVTELYSAVLAREPDVAGLAFYQNFLKANPTTPLQTFADYFLSSSEYTSAHNYAETTAGDEQFITDSYRNLLHRTPLASEVSFYENNVLAPAVANLTPGTQAYANAQFQAHALMLVYFSASSEFLSDVQITAANPASAQHWLILT